MRPDGVAVAPPTGTALAELEARSAVRRVMASYIDACDVEKDPELIADHFTPDGIWQGVGKGEEFGRNVGRDAIVEMFTVNPSRQPWTVHYLMGERIEVDGDRARGRWQCLESSVIRHGRLGVWMGVTYDNDFVRTKQGWRLAHIRCGEEFITPYDQGWAVEADLHVIDDRTSGPGIPDWLVHRPIEVHDRVPGDVPSGSVADRTEALVAERAVRRLVHDHLGALDRGDAATAVPWRFLPDARWVGVGAYERFGTAVGHGEIRVVLDQLTARHPDQTHHLANEWIEVDGDRAVGRWICLVTATDAQGEPWWLGQRYRVEARRSDGVWHIAELRCRDIVTAPYAGGWLAATPG
jgi:ketosteroid isomerase-like protein